MADKVTTSKTLGVGLEYISTETQKAKTVYLKLENPKTNVTETTIKTAVQNLISGDDPIFLTPEEEEFNSATAVSTAYVEEVRTTEFDIGVD